LIDKTKIRVIRVDGMGFIATPNGQKLVNAMKADYDTPDLKTFIKKDNIGELETVTVGDGKTVISRQLRPDEAIQWDIYAQKLAQIKTIALARVENDQFDKSF